MPRSVQLSSNSRAFFSLVLALSCAIAMAAPASAPDREREDQMVETLHRDLARSFALNSDLPLDASLRTSAEAISAAHLAGIDKLLRAWIEQESAVQAASGTKHGPNDLFYAVWARVLNELALWQLEPGDADYERATLAVLVTSPRVCDDISDRRFTDFSSRILRLQKMPPAQRSAALATERRLLSHWGQARPALAPWPDPLPQDAAMSLIKGLPGGGPRPALALPPMVVSPLLGERKAYTAIDPAVQCRLQQWWLQESLHHGAAPAAALNAFRYGTLISANDRFVGMFEPPKKDPKAAEASSAPDYPKLASRFGVTGATTVQVQLGAGGAPHQANVVERKIKVDGIRGVRPVAFENTFDSVSIHHAMAQPHYDKQAGDAPFKFQMVWSLDGPAGAAAHTPKGAGK